MPEIISRELLDILVCPECKQKIILEGAPPTGWGLICSACKLKYPIIDGIPVMLKDQAVSIS
jgi:uncharacterized protein